MGYQAEKARFLQAVTGGAADAKRASQLNAVIYGGDRWGRAATGGDRCPASGAKPPGQQPAASRGVWPCSADQTRGPSCLLRCAGWTARSLSGPLTSS